MAYRLDRDASLGAGLRRAAGEVLADASAVLRAPPDGDAARAVHEARKAVKKARAALRLGRELLPAKQRKALDRALRDLGRTLAPARDGTVRLATARETARDAGRDGLGAELEAWLTATVPHAAGVRPEEREPVALAERADAFDALRDRVERAGWRDGGAKPLRQGLERLFEDGRAAYARIGDPPDAERLHACRRHVKRIAHALRLLTPAWPPLVAAGAQEAGRLAELLGRDHDRALLRAALSRDDLPAGTLREAAELMATLDDATARDRAAAMPLLRRLFAEEPRGFAARHAAWWSAWREDAG